MSQVNSSQFKLILTIVLISLPLTYLVFRHNEKSIATSAQRFLEESQIQEGSVEVGQVIFRFFCSSSRHAYCSIRITNTNNQVLTSIPTLITKKPSIFEQSIQLQLTQFQPPLFITLNFLPSFSVFILLLTIAFSIAGITAILVWAFGLRAAKNSLEQSLKLESELRKVEAGFGNLAAQVAHDIRSPIAALSVMEREFGGLTEEKRLLIRSAINRIKDIANNLLYQNKTLLTKTGSEQRLATEQPSIILLPSIIEPIITEKRMQYRSKIGIEIDVQFDSSSYGIFANIQSTEFKRVISNLVNNAVEVLDEKGSVLVSLTRESHCVELRIIDNGKGIPPEILAKLGQRGETYGKPGGSGLGLFHARSSIESWGGKLTIESQLGKGTCVIITLPKIEAPIWFASRLNLTPNTAVVVLDDDSSIHAVWQGRFESLRVQENGIEIFHFSTPTELTNFANENPKAKTALFLTDYELLGHTQTGLDLIHEQKIGPQSILVTSRFEENQIRETCEKLKIRMIPKGMAGFVPITVAINEPPHTLFEAILIDDDPLVRLTWESGAKKNNLKILTYASPDGFFKNAKGIHPLSPIYVDSNLGNGIKGEDISKTIFDLGFHKVYLATGYELNSFPSMPWLSGIIGKEAPWESIAE